MMPDELNKNKMFFGYTEDELRSILIELEKHYNYYEMLDWFKKNAPDQTYVNQRTVFGVIRNYKTFNVIKFCDYRKTCISCNSEFYTNNLMTIYCSKDCKYNEYKKRSILRKGNPEYKRSIVQIPARTSYEIKKRTTYDESLNLDITGSDSLFCDTDFLERILGKKLKKTDDCK